MILETERLYLRELTMNDLDELHHILSDPVLMQHYPAPFNLERTTNWITWNIENYSKYGFGLWAVILKGEEKFIGDCGITMQNINGNMEPEIGYHINKRYQKRGYATEAAAECMKYAFEILYLEQVFSYMNVANIPSQLVAQKNGMKHIMDYKDEKKNYITSVYGITLDEYRQICSL